MDYKFDGMKGKNQILKKKEKTTEKNKKNTCLQMVGDFDLH